MVTEPTCKIDGCENVGRYDRQRGKRYLKRGMCGAHYEKWRRTGNAEGPDGRGRPRKVNGPTKVCKGCKETKDTEADFYKRGDWIYTYCKKCHNKRTMAVYLRHKLERGPLVKVEHGECDFEDCGRKAKTQIPNGPVGWYCGTHYNQWLVKKELRPVRKQTKPFKNDKFRECTVCHIIKSVDDYHVRVTGVVQAVCKVCAGQQARFHRLMRETRYEEALEKAQAMAEDAREKYVDLASTAIRQRELERSDGQEN